MAKTKKCRLIKRRKNPAQDVIGLRGSVEVVLKNALTGDEILHDKDENVVFYCGRSWAMDKALCTTTLAGTMTNSMVVGVGSLGAASTAYTNTALTTYYTYKTGTITSYTNTGSTVPYMNVQVSWVGSDISDSQFTNPGIREFGLRNSTGNAGTMLCRYESSTFITATTSNQLLVTYTVSW